MESVLISVKKMLNTQIDAENCFCDEFLDEITYPILP